MKVPQWSIDAINGGRYNGATLNQQGLNLGSGSQRALGMTGSMLTLGGAAVSVGAFTMYTPDTKLFGKGHWYSLAQGKSYGLNFNGNQYTGGRLSSGKAVSNAFTGFGVGLGVLNAASIEYQYANGEIGRTTRYLEQGSNVISTAGGIYGAAWGIGWEGGRLITKIPGYHEYVRMPVRRAFNVQVR